MAMIYFDPMPAQSVVPKGYATWGDDSLAFVPVLHTTYCCTGRGDLA